jgi:hypothetical protein
MPTRAAGRPKRVKTKSMRSAENMASSVQVFALGSFERAKKYSPGGALLRSSDDGCGGDA